MGEWGPGGTRADGRTVVRSGNMEKEIEAEAIAFLIAARAGLTTRSAEYLAVHAQRADIGDIDIDLVVR